jgi:hypothetical protein
VTAKGYLPAKQSANVGEGASATVTFKLAPAPTAAVSPPPPHVDAGTTTSHVKTPVAPPPNRALPVALMGGGAALLVGGVVVGMLGVKDASNAPTKDGPEAHSAKTKALIGDVVGGAGIVAAGVGLVLFVTTKPAKREASRSIAPWAAGPVGGVSVRF